MSSPGYVFCKWKKVFWPAKVLSQENPISGNSLVHVEILCLDEQLHVKHKDTKPLDKREVENIAAELASRIKSPYAPIKELTYRKALRIALDILSQNSSESSHTTPGEFDDPNTANKRKLFISSKIKGKGQKDIQKLPSINIKQKETADKSSIICDDDSSTGGANLAATENVPAATENVPPAKSLPDKRQPIKLYPRRKRTRDLRNDYEKEVCKETKIIKESRELQDSSEMYTEQNILSEDRGDTKESNREELYESCISDYSKSPQPENTEVISPAQYSVSENTELQGVDKWQKRGMRIQNFSKNNADNEEDKGLCQQDPAVLDGSHLDITTPERKAEMSKETFLDISGKTSLAVEGCAMKNRGESRATHMPKEESTEKLNQQRRKLVQRRAHLNRMSKIHSDRKAISKQNESSETDNESVGFQPIIKYMQHPLPDFKDEGGLASSELSMEISSPENCSLYPTWPEEDPEEDQLPSVFLQQGPSSIEPGMFVWCKFQKYPYWPSVVKTVRKKDRKATVVFVEESLSDPNKKKKGFSVSLRNLKPYDCTEKKQFLADAREDYGESIDWCDAVISDYRIRMGCGSFSGSFAEYCTADISYPVRKEIRHGKLDMLFPSVDTESCESPSEVTPSKSQPNRKMLPDRQRAARDRANERLVEYIVKTKQAESHLLEILRGKKRSRWLRDFQASNKYMNCTETYLEDEEQVELVVEYLQTLCEHMGSTTEKLMKKDQMGFILDVLLPEAIIFAISAVDEVDYEKAEKKYLDGPSVSKREKSQFEQQILQKKKLQALEKLGGQKKSAK